MTQSYLICRPLFRVLLAGIFLLGAFAWAGTSDWETSERPDSHIQLWAEVNGALPGTGAQV